MRLRTTLMLAVAALLLAAAYVVLDVLPQTRIPSTAEQRREAGAVFGGPDFREGEGPRAAGLRRLIGRLVIRRGKEVVELERVSPPPRPRWRLLRPVATEAAPGEADAICFMLETLHALRQVAPEAGRPLNLAAYGLRSPPLSVTFTVAKKDGRESTWTLDVGLREPLENLVYVKRADQPVVYAVDARVVARLTLPVNVLRDRRVLVFDPRRVTAVEVAARGAPPLRCTRDEAGDWRLVRPVRDAARAAPIETWLEALGRCRIEPEDFVAQDDARLAAFGLRPPALRLSVEEEGRSAALLVGAATEDGRKRYARRGDSAGIFLLDAARVKGFRLSAYEVRSRRPVALDPERVTEVALHLRDEQTLTLRHEGGAWRLGGPRGREADGDRVRALLRTLSGETIAGWADGADPAEVRYSLRPPLARIEVLLRGGERRALGLGALDADRRFLFAQRGETGPVFRLPAGLLSAELTGGRLHFLSRKIFAFTDREVERLVVERPGVTFDCRREGRDWMLSRPVEVMADPRAVRRLLLRIHLLHAVRHVAERPEDLTAYGLKPPEMRLTVTLAPRRAGGARRVKSLELGAAAGPEGYYARTGEGNVVSLVPAEVRDALRAELASRTVCRFPPAKALSVTVERAGRPALRCVREKGRWKATAGRAEPLAVSALVDAAGRLEAAAVVAHSRRDDAKYGLKPPRATVTVRLKGMQYEIRIGNPKGEEGCYVAVGTDGPLVYLVPRDVIKRLLLEP